MTTIKITPPRVAFVDKTGLISREWYLFLLGLFQQAGGSDGYGLGDVQVMEMMDSDAVPASARDALDFDTPDQKPAQFDGYEIHDSVIPHAFSLDPDAPDESRAFLLRAIQDAVLLAIEPDEAPAGPQPVATITVGASPYTYTALMPGAVIVEGGGVSTLEFSRGGVTFINTGSYYGMFPLEKGDKLKVTHVSAPNMTFVPRSA